MATAASATHASNAAAAAPAAATLAVMSDGGGRNDASFFFWLQPSSSQLCTSCDMLRRAQPRYALNVTCTSTTLASRMAARRLTDGACVGTPDQEAPEQPILAQINLSEEESGAGCVLPPQPRVTAQIMRHWGPHVSAKDEPPSSRCKHLGMLHRTHLHRHPEHGRRRARPLHPAA